MKQSLLTFTCLSSLSLFCAAGPVSEAIRAARASYSGKTIGQLNSPFRSDASRAADVYMQSLMAKVDAKSQFRREVHGGEHREISGAITTTKDGKGGTIESLLHSDYSSSRTTIQLPELSWSTTTAPKIMPHVYKSGVDAATYSTLRTGRVGNTEMKEELLVGTRQLNDTTYRRTIDYAITRDNTRVTVGDVVKDFTGSSMDVVVITGNVSTSKTIPLSLRSGETVIHREIKGDKLIYYTLNRDGKIQEVSHDFKLQYGKYVPEINIVTDKSKIGIKSVTTEEAQAIGLIVKRTQNDMGAKIAQGSEARGLRVDRVSEGTLHRPVEGVK